MVTGGVLVDHLNTSVLALTVEYLGPVSIPFPALKPYSLAAELCENLGVEVTEPAPEQLYSAATAVRSSTRVVSFEERLCQIVAGGSKRTVLGDNRLLKTLCDENGVPFCFVPELMDRVVRHGRLARREALRIERARQQRRSLLIGVTSSSRLRLGRTGGGRRP